MVKCKGPNSLPNVLPSQTNFHTQSVAEGKSQASPLEPGAWRGRGTPLGPAADFLGGRG